MTIFMLVSWPVIHRLNNLNFSESFNCQQSKQPLLLQDQPIEQTFLISKDNLDEISLKVATYKKNIFGKLNFKIKNPSNQVIFFQKIDIQDMKDNEFYDIHLKPNILHKEILYTLQISYEDKTPDRLAFWISQQNCFSGSLSTGESLVENADLLIHFKYKQETFKENFFKLINRISQYKPLFFKTEAILLLFTTFFSLLLFFLFLLIKKLINF